MTRIGMISFEHMHALSYAQSLVQIPNVELVGIYDDDFYRGSTLSSELNTRYFDDVDALLASNLDGVIICTNNKDHEPMVIKASEYKVPSLVEKPFAVSLEAAENMISVAKQHGVFVMNALPMRFNPSIMNGKEVIDSGAIGEIVSIVSQNHGKIPDGWFLDKEKAGGGAMIDHTVHLADIIRWYTGSEFKTVYCESGELLHNKGVEDTGIVFTELENGVLATIDFSWAHHKNYPIWPQVDLEIIGTKGVLNIKGFAQKHHVVNPLTDSVTFDLFGESGDEGLVKAFVEACRNKEGIHPNDIDGIRSTELAIAAYESSASHEVVKVERYEKA
ncbi:Gfo/Idh/MocA family protein [Erysipelothrix urinaevulpis]|uniref:Gfo/Idh/MocA family protein n=1 Tax=Erysipelothrix urinaevulpis TaxID=2683717 RepID=UPI0013597BC9|nr:Gfo/Idh/MocA family oxidoreductase [Erysipelothrix urinaevulpis]